MNEIKLFINENIIPGDIVLVVNAPKNLLNEFNNFFKYLNSSLLFISDNQESHYDMFLNFDTIPFDTNSIDLIVNFDKHFPELDRVLKKNGKILINFLDK
jgi:hypothetical protein